MLEEIKKKDFIIFEKEEKIKILEKENKNIKDLLSQKEEMLTVANEELNLLKDIVYKKS